jgi:mannitol/fructose-specific phosphotransferase system IIA component (Ntr-type)
VTDEVVGAQSGRISQRGTAESEDSLVLLNVQAAHLADCFDALCVQLERRNLCDQSQIDRIQKVLSKRADGGPDVLENGVATVHQQLDFDAHVQVLIRLTEPLSSLSADGKPIHFVWVLLSRAVTHSQTPVAAEFTALMDDPAFAEAALKAGTVEELENLYDSAVQAEVHFAHIPPGLERTGRLFGGISDDIKRRLPFYASDFKDGLNPKAIASVGFLYFACLAPAVAFGGLLAVLTNGELGAVEMIVATALCGVSYALVSGQPLTILGSTGPVIIFMGILYSLCTSLGLPYLPTLAWVGLWTSLFLIILAVTDACSWIRYFTRFTDDTFAALIALIFIAEALKDIIGVFTDHEVSYATALLSLVLALGTYQIATSLKQFRSSVYLRRWVREFLADFGPTIAILVMTGIAFWLHEVELEMLPAPDTVQTTSGRPWLVNPLEAPKWVWAASSLPAVLVTILLYLDQNITVRLVNNAEYKLQKGSGYHLDLAVVGVLVGICSILGLPWMVAATVRSLNHVRSLVTVEGGTDGRPERVTGTMENRVTALSVHMLIGLSLLALPLLQLVPMSVLFGLFLFMGVASMSGNQLFERMRLWIVDPAQFPPTYYLRAVPRGVVSKYTFIQTACLGVLWVVKTSVLGILFPLFIALLVPVRMVLDRMFKAEHLALLDAEEEPEEEGYREVE